MKSVVKTELVIFKNAKGQVKLRGDFRNETMWATQAEIASVFGVTPQIFIKTKSYESQQLVRNPYKFKKRVGVKFPVP
jgi:hypothetical protein